VEFWAEAVRDVLERSGSSSDIGEQDRDPAVDEAMYQYIRVELAKAFPVPQEDIPNTLRFEWHYWDDGAV
jgi:hypothetical protein